SATSSWIAMLPGGTARSTRPTVPSSPAAASPRGQSAVDEPCRHRHQPNFYIFAYAPDEPNVHTIGATLVIPAGLDPICHCQYLLRLNAAPRMPAILPTPRQSASRRRRRLLIHGCARHTIT